jgi:predicted membrane channel-forming protein YqfA (hemolysin III family)
MFRKGISVLLAVLTLFFTTLAILGIWEIIDVKNIAWKSISSIFVIFVASAIILFIFSVIYKGGDDKLNPPPNS